MKNNKGRTTLRGRKSSTSPMRDFDRLPPELRAWVSQAMLPWSAKSVEKAYNKAVARTGDVQRALCELDRLQRSLVAKDAGRVWDGQHPASVEH